MAENVMIYAGSNKAGKLRKRALEKEAFRRGGKNFPVSKLIWEFIEGKYRASIHLQQDLATAELLEK